MFINEKLSFFIGRQAEFKKLLDFIESDKRIDQNQNELSESTINMSLEDQPASIEAKIKNKNSIIITGWEGCGSKCKNEKLKIKN